MSDASAATTLNELLNAERPLFEVAEYAADVGAEHLNVEYGYLARIIPELDHWVVVASTAEEGPVAVGEATPYHTTFCRHAADTGHTVALGDVSNSEYAGDIAAQRHEWKCHASVPIALGDGLYGTLCFSDRTPKREGYHDTKIDFINALGTILERNFARREYETALDNRNRLLGIFGRLLRHNLRNDTSIIKGYLELLIDQLNDPDPDPEIIRSSVDRLITLSEKSHELRKIAQTRPTFREIPVDAILKRVARRLESDYSGLHTHVEAPTPVRLLGLPTIETAVYELGENAAIHAGPDTTCWLSIDPAPETVTIAVVDDGPGLPPQEQRVIRGEHETALNHGQGIGLWIVRWVITGHDGTVAVDVDGTGTTIRITLPRPTANGRLTTQQPLSR